VDEVCNKLVVGQGPYACVKTETTTESPSFAEALSVAYANIALASTIFIPLVAFVAAKISGWKSEEDEEDAGTELPKVGEGDTAQVANPIV